MTLQEFIDLLSDEEKQQFDDICEQVASNKFNPKTFFALFKVVWDRVGKTGNHMRVAGPLKGQLLRQFGPKKGSKKQAEQERSLNAIGQNLPFPLGYKTLSFAHDLQQRKEGIEPPQFALDICATLSVVLRLMSVISIQSYVQATGGSDWSINKEIVTTLRTASDGSWLNISQRLTSKFSDQSPWLKLLGTIFKSKENIPQSILAINPKFKKDAAKNYLQKLIKFRNELMHGERQSAEDINIAACNLEMVLRSLHHIEAFELLVNHNDEIWSLNGRVPTKTDRKEDYPENQVFLVPNNSDLEQLNLSPLLYFRSSVLASEEIEFDELFFINSGSLDYLKYVGFAATEHIDGKTLGSYEQFKSYLSKIPTPPIPKDPRIKFDQFVADRTKRFVGRSNVLSEIESAIEANPGSYISLKAYAGMGKSSILAKLYTQYNSRIDNRDEKGDRWVFHFCMNTEGRNNSLVAYRSLIAQICRALDIPEKKWLSSDIKEIKDERFPALINSEKCKEKLEALGGKRLVIVLDALDEGIGTEEESIPSCIPMSLQPHVVFLYSYRVDAKDKNQRVENRLTHLPTENIYQLESANPLDGLTLEDVQLYLYKSNEENPVPENVEQAVWQAATQNSKGADPFYLRFVSDAAETKHISLLRAETIPESMDDAFEQLWIRLPTENDFLVHKVLLNLGIMRDYGDDELFAELFNRQLDEKNKIHPIDIAAARIKAGKLLLYDGDRYGLFHDRFRTFLVGEQKDPIAEALGMNS